MNVEDAYAAVDALAEWSPWSPLATVDYRAVTGPGTYMMRVGADGKVVYAGFAGMRSGEGIRGRLNKYRGLSSGFGQAVLARALADPAFLESRLAELRVGRVRTPREWVRLAIDSQQIEVRWAVAIDEKSASEIEVSALRLLAPHGLWNLKLPRRSSSGSS